MKTTFQYNQEQTTLQRCSTLRGMESSPSNLPSQKSARRVIFFPRTPGFQNQLWACQISPGFLMPSLPSQCRMVDQQSVRVHLHITVILPLQSASVSLRNLRKSLQNLMRGGSIPSSNPRLQFPATCRPWEAVVMDQVLGDLD